MTALARVPRARTAVLDLQSMVVHELRVLRAALPDDPSVQQAMTTVESFVAVSLALMAKTNPSKVRDVAMTAEIRWRLDGKPEA